MKIKTFGAAIGSVIAVGITAVAKLKPETLYGMDFSFLEYLLSIFANPLMYATVAACSIVLGILGTKFGRAGVKEIWTWKEHDTKDIRAKIQQAGHLPLIVALGALLWLSYESYALLRNSVSFLRDRFSQQYQVDAFSRCRLEEARGHLTLAKTCFVSFSKSFEGHPLSETASRDIKRLDKQLELKNALLQKARTSERVFGPTPLSVHLKIEALWLHPWDSELRREIQDELDSRFAKGTTRLLQAREQCAVGRAISLPAAREGLGLLGYMRAAEVGPILVDGQALADRLCAMVRPISSEQLRARVTSIWQSQRIDAILAATDPARLEQDLQKAITDYRYPALKERLLKGHGRAASDPAEQEAIEAEQRQPRPVLPDVMIVPPKTRQHNGIAAGPDTTPPVPVRSPSLGMPPPPLPPQVGEATDGKSAVLPPLPIVPALKPPLSGPRVIKPIGRSY